MINAIRSKLLDLTTRNPLVHFRHPKSSCLRLIDELPNQVFEVLQNGGKFTFIPVPEPTQQELIDNGYIDPENRSKILEFPSAEQWARHLGFATTYDLSNESLGDKHKDTKLQTMLYATELEARLRNIRGNAVRAIEESGTNILYLALGFLEWYEDRNSETSRLAPLFTLPVQIEKSGLDKGAGVYRYIIQIKDDALINNVTLKSKLANDFGLILPDIDEDTKPESYFEEIRETILQHQPRWQIRRYASLLLLNFSKQAIYEDLDPNNWPSQASLLDHPLVRLFFTNQGDSNSEFATTYETEYPIDEAEDIHQQYPVIYDADSSQHSAVIDSVNGEDLVIEGPPGSGKSQTITNIVAACIANGKKVLFVAEKMAALNVVKNRLDQAGLGDFCLELHSHKTNKQKIMSDISQRLSSQSDFISPNGFDTDIERYENFKKKLNNYVFDINSKWANTGLTKQQILQKATRLREHYRIDPEQLKIEGIKGENLSPIRQSELTDLAYMLENIFHDVSKQAQDGKIYNHFWYGVQKTDLSEIQSKELISLLVSWTDILSKLKMEWIRLQTNILEIENKNTCNLLLINQLIESTLRLPDLKGGELLDKLDFFIEKEQEIENWLDNYEKLHSLSNCLQTNIKAEALSSFETPKIISDIINVLKQSGLPDSYSLELLAIDANQSLQLLTLANNVESKLGLIRQNTTSVLQSIFSCTVNSLEEIATLIKLIELLPLEMWSYRDNLFDNRELDYLIPILSERLSAIRPIHDRLNSSVRLDKLPNLQELKEYQAVIEDAGIFKWFSGKWRNARKNILALQKQKKSKNRILERLIRDLINYSEELEKIHKIHNDNPILGTLFQGLESPINRISILRNWYKQVRNEYGIGFGERVNIGKSLLNIDRDFAFALVDEAAGLRDNIQLLLSGLEKIRTTYPNHSLCKNRSLSLSGESGELQKFSLGLSNILNKLSKIFKNKELSINEIYDHQYKLTSLQQESTNWGSNHLKDLITPNSQRLSLDSEGFSDSQLAAARNSIIIAKIINESQPLKAAITNNPSNFKYRQIKDEISELQRFLTLENDSRSLFVAHGAINLNDWYATTNHSIVSIIDRNNAALTQQQWLNTWLDYIKLRNRLLNQGLINLLNLLVEGRINCQNLPDILSLAIYHQLAQEIIAENPELADFSGLEHSSIQKRFKEYDKRILENQRKNIAFRATRHKPLAGNSAGRVSDKTEMGLIKHLLQPNTRRIPVRSLLKRAGTSIQILKPCFMMSPMSVAQYLEPGQLKFDLIIMDEASQIRPEEALGAIARGKQLIVVGDSNQLPPTNFFNSGTDNIESEDDDDNTLQVSESILGAVAPMLTNRRLRWHYRSKHESLIAFSNKHFYNTDLEIFPSPFQESPEFGIKNHRVARGRFVNQHNVEEAYEVVQAAVYHLLNHPTESLGLVAMNAKQRDEIEKQLEQQKKDNPALDQAFRQNEDTQEPLFIKNLENVQGDERDVIYISMTYGPDTIGGRTMQRFGPINSDAGWRRLNVLFTRAKKRMHIFSTMTSGDILATPQSSRGVQALKSFLEYAETGHLHQSVQTGNSPDNDFELSVKHFLKSHGYECESQLGVAGFKLDLAVRDPGKPGRFLMGIECDGATYHSAKSARDRDILRQQILEDLGWKIRRIWSTDWFKHPQAQIQPILNELEQLRTPIYQDIKIEEQESEYIAFLSEEKNQPFEQSDSDAVTRILGIRERLISFDENNIRIEFPDTEESEKLLRAEMLDALEEYRPTSKAEFQEYIPGYLRAATSAREGKYLEQVLAMIADFG